MAWFFILLALTLDSCKYSDVAIPSPAWEGWACSSTYLQDGKSYKSNFCCRSYPTQKAIQMQLYPQILVLMLSRGRISAPDVAR